MASARRNQHQRVWTYRRPLRRGADRAPAGRSVSTGQADGPGRRARCGRERARDGDLGGRPCPEPLVRIAVSSRRVLHSGGNDHLAARVGLSSLLRRPICFARVVTRNRASFKCIFEWTPRVGGSRAGRGAAPPLRLEGLVALAAVREGLARPLVVGYADLEEPVQVPFSVMAPRSPGSSLLVTALPAIAHVEGTPTQAAAPRWGAPAKWRGAILRSQGTGHRAHHFTNFEPRYTPLLMPIRVMNPSGMGGIS